MLRAHRLWTCDKAHNELCGLHDGRSWGSGIVQAHCQRCDKLATSICVKEHGAGLYACMEESHLDYYAQFAAGSAPLSKGAVWCWGAIRQEGMHVWAQFALPEAMMNAACRPALRPHELHR